MTAKNNTTREVVKAQLDYILDEHTTDLGREVAMSVGVACFHEGYKYAVKKVFRILMA